MAKVFTLDGINQEFLRGSRGNDIVQGSADKPGVWNGRRGVIRLRQGDDVIRSDAGIRLYGETSMGAGRDRITGVSRIYLLAIDNRNGSLAMGKGADVVEVSKGPLVIGDDSFLSMGDGNDLIRARSLYMNGASLETGAGDDRIDVGDGSVGLGFFDTLSMGDGDDWLIARGGLRVSESTLSMGAGDDIIDVGDGGIDLWSFDFDSIRLGSGNDRLIGFAASPASEFPPTSSGGVVRGGKGQDTLVLSEGVYTVTDNRVSTDDTYLNVAGFNLLEGINGGRFAYAPGVLTVNENGVASFSTGV